MENFLTKFCEHKRFMTNQEQKDYDALFSSTITRIYDSLGTKAFKPERGLNTAVYDSVMVAVAERLKTNAEYPLETLVRNYDSLLANDEFKILINSSTSDEKNVAKRIEISIRTFSEGA